MQTNAINKMLK